MLAKLAVTEGLLVVREYPPDPLGIMETVMFDPFNVVVKDLVVFEKVISLPVRVLAANELSLFSPNLLIF